MLIKTHTNRLRRKCTGSDCCVLSPESWPLLAEPPLIVNNLIGWQLRLYGRGHVLHRSHAVDAAQIALAIVVADQRRGFPVIAHQPPAGRLRRIVGPAQELLAAAHVAGPGRSGPAEAVVIAGPTGGAGKPPGNALDELIIVHFQFDDSVELKLLALEH